MPYIIVRNFVPSSELQLPNIPGNIAASLVRRGKLGFGLCFERAGFSPHRNIAGIKKGIFRSFFWRCTYNFDMARGWESRSIEAQQAEASNERSQPRAKLTAQQAARKHQIDGLALSRQRVRQQLAAAQDLRFRRMLEGALDDLERRLRDLQTD